MNISLSRKTLTVIAFIFIASVVKFFLISGNEVITVNPDASGYVYQASVFFHPKSDIEQRPLIYPLFLLICQYSGIPLRFTIELLFILSCLFFVGSIRWSGLNRKSSLLIFVFLIFNPLSCGMNNTTFSETLYVCLLLVFTGLSIFFFFSAHSRDTNRLAILLGVVFFSLWHTRDEVLLHLLLLGGTLIIKTGTAIHRYKNFVFAFHRFKYPFGFLLLTFCVLHLCVLSFNYVRCGYFETASLLNNDRMALLNTLTKIADNSTEKYVRIKHATLETAYKVSPTLRVLRPFFHETDELKSGLVMENGEFDAACFLWQYIEVLDKAQFTREQCRQAIHEIEEAFRVGLLPKRFSLGYMFPIDFNHFSNLPRSFYSVSTTLYTNYANLYNSSHSFPMIPLYVQSLYDIVTNRRIAPISRGNIEGWCFVEGYEIEKIEFVPNAYQSYHTLNEVVGVTTKMLPRADVQSHYAALNPPLNSGFHTTGAKYDYRWQDMGMLIYLKNKPILCLREITPGQAVNVTMHNNQFRIHYYIDAQKIYVPQITQTLVQLQIQWGAMYRFLLLALILASLACFLFFLLSTCGAKRGNRQIDKHRLLILLWLCFVISVRLFQYAVIDALFYPIPPLGDFTDFPNVGPRFFYPVIILFPALWIILLNLWTTTPPEIPE